MRGLSGLMPPVADCACAYCAVLRGRVRDGAEFELRDTEPPAKRPSADELNGIAPDFLERLGAAMKKWNGEV